MAEAPVRSRLYLAIFLLVLAPAGAAVVVAVLLLFGMPPHSVFAPGFAMRSFLANHGMHAPNAVGVLTTVGMWWLLFAVAGLAWEGWRRRQPRS